MAYLQKIQTQESIKMAAIWMSVSLGFLPAFGFDLASAKRLNDILYRYFIEDEIRWERNSL